ncbi:fibronectin type III domain-containing protein [uncultured Chitinophaga sp.]|uniref:fibronectin type III domain-containing protein n=1 Tax=uncultured Chitinophaga sp. TaxID=339340 RepID=UPI0025D044B8|nr:fibronectin type III domain-containing protein [uncultured Chitinophaga sp.]
MKQLYRLLLSIVLLASAFVVKAQTGVLNPNDPIVVYNAASPPATPAWGVLAKWVKTNRLNWNTSSYKAYYFNGGAFRVKFPKSYQHGVNDGKVYPMIIFFHGVGEKGTIYDNEFQLYHGGQVHMNKVDNGDFDGFLVYPQNTSGFFGAGDYDRLNILINNYFVPQAKVDINRIYVEGLSGGGSATWEILIGYPKLIAGASPISAASLSFKNSVNSYKYTPIWQFQGGLDKNPDPGTATDVYNNALAAGANMKLSIYPQNGHDSWNKAWAEADFFPNVNRANKTNPWPLTGRTEFCPGDAINLTLGLTAGFDGYEWRKNGVVIPGATGNTIAVNSIGTYDARIKRGSTWSYYSPIPVVIKIKTPTVPPAITLAGLQSRVIPAPDGKTSVTLQVPSTYATYSWKNVANNTVLGTTNTLTVSTPGSYTVKVTEQYGCSSDFSTPYTVVNANGANAPAAPSNVSVLPVSKTQLEVNWVKNPNAPNPETGFEIYRASTPGGAYTLIDTVVANTLSYVDDNLNANTPYYYVVRAVNNNGGSPKSAEGTGTTLNDEVAPTAPANLTIAGNAGSFMVLTWTASTDDVAVSNYDIYINGTKSYSVAGDKTTATVYNLVKGQLYNIVVKARDLTGNVSPASNQVAALAYQTGLKWKYYPGSTTYSAIPDFSLQTPAATGISPRPDVTIATQADYFGIMWEGFIKIPASGNYTFETVSDDGAAVVINGTTVNTRTTAGTATGTINLAAGTYPIKISYTENTGSASIRLYWKNTPTGIGNSRQEIPVTQFVENEASAGVVPAAPTQLKATASSYNNINLTWTDNSDNETGFEIYRSATYTGTYTTVGTVGANVTSYADAGLAPSKEYYYKVKAINAAGSSAFNTLVAGLDYKYYEFTSAPAAMPDFAALTPKKTGNVTTVSMGMRDRSTNYGLVYTGHLNIATSSSNYIFYLRADDAAQLYIDGVRWLDNTVADKNIERSANVPLIAGLHTIEVRHFNGASSSLLDLRYSSPSGPTINKTTLAASLFPDGDGFAKTLALPAAPAAPANLVATAASATSVGLTWTNNGTDVTSFELYRSVNNNSNFKLHKTIEVTGALPTSYTDTALFSNVTYFYKLRAKNAGGASVYSAEASATALNNPPTITQLTNKAIHYTTPLTLNVTANSPDNQALTLTTANLPVFATFQNNGNGTATINIVPTIASLGTYNNISVTATDEHGGMATTSFSLVVIDNYIPALGTIAPATVKGGSSISIPLTVSDANVNDEIEWNVTGLPSFATFNSDGRTATITAATSYADAGVYPITVTVNDDNGGTDTQTFNLSVSLSTPNSSIYVNFTDGSATGVATGFWNNTNKVPAINDVFANLKDSTNTVTGVGIRIMSNWQNEGNGTNLLGGTTGNNSGVFPDNVMRSAYWTGTNKQTLKVTGLNTDPNYTYKFTFFGSRGSVSDNRTSTYTIGATTVSLNAAGNTQNTVNIANVVADANGEVTIDLKNGTGSVYAYLNALVIEAVYDDHSVPAKANNLTATEVATGVRLNWLPVAYNDNGYEVYRATSHAGPYTLLNPGASNAHASSYADNTATGGSSYYYTVRAYNSYGFSAYSDTVQIATTSKPPVLTDISNINIKSNVTQNIAVNVKVDPGTVVALSGINLPAFATLTDNGDGTGNLALAPNATQVGVYNNVKIKATDNFGNGDTTTFSITVKDASTTAIFVNFNEVSPAGSPWNNYNRVPAVNGAITNMVDENGAGSGVTITQLDAIEGVNALGATTGGNTGIYPDAVMQSSYYDGSGAAKRFRLTGLATDRKYNLVFFGSRSAVVDNRTTDYTAGGQTVSLNAASNTANTVQINGLSPNASGEIEFSFKKNSAAVYGYLNALVIQSYEDNGVPLAPSNLTATSKSKTSIGLTWANKASGATANEIYRSTSADGTFNLLTTVSGTTASYTDNGLATNAKYYYKVRTKVGTVNSEYSNLADAATYAYSIYMNFNRDNPAGSPWNNTNNVPQLNDKYLLFNDEGNNSGISVEVTKDFSGENPFGMVTGNNSGVFPDNVIRSTWWLDVGVTSKLKVTGLNLSQSYTFVFFGSRDGDGDRTTVYTVNGKSVSLNCAKNVNNTVQLTDIRPDANGEAEITISLGATSSYGYIGALVIHGYEAKDEATQSQTINARTIAVGNTQSTTIIDYAFNKKENDNKLEVNQVYPNPFKDAVTLNLDNKGTSKRVAVRLFDLSGKQVFGKALGDLGVGRHNLRVEFGSTANATGFYLLEVIADNKSVKTIKLIKK